MSRDAVDPHEAMMMHCLFWYVQNFGDEFVPYDEVNKHLVARKSVEFTPVYERENLTGFQVRLIEATGELAESRCACLGIPHREDCRLQTQ